MRFEGENREPHTPTASESLQTRTGFGKYRHRFAVGSFPGLLLNLPRVVGKLTEGFSDRTKSSGIEGYLYSI